MADFRSFFASSGYRRYLRGYVGDIETVKNIQNDMETGVICVIGHIEAEAAWGLQILGIHEADSHRIPCRMTVGLLIDLLKKHGQPTWTPCGSARNLGKTIL